MAQRLTTAGFIERSRKAHGNKYDYSKTQYVRQSEPVCIICPEHGEFWQHPTVHYNGGNCPKCVYAESSKRQRFTKEKFIEKARKIHGDKFDYSQVDYVTAKVKVKIICPEHGEFWQTPDSHTSKTIIGCPQCGIEAQRASKLNPPEIGERFGRLTVVDFSHWTVHDRIVNGRHFPTNRGIWRFQCDCGNQIEADIASVRQRAKKKGDTGCGCIRDENTDSRNQQAMLETKNKVMKMLELLGDKVDFSKAIYRDYKTPVTGLICRIHNEEYSAHPATILKGRHGCNECGKEVSGWDSVDRFLSDKELADSPCKVYVANINHDYIKPGIAKNEKLRSKGGYYKGFPFVSPTLTRAEAWAIEQCMLFQTRQYIPDSVPDLPENFGGLTELRLKSKLAASELIAMYHQLYDLLCQHGWLTLFNMRPHLSLI